MRLTYILILYVVCLFQGKIASQEISKDDSEVIRYSSYREVRGNKLTVTDTLVVQINNRDGDSAAEVDIVYSKGEKPSIDFAWIEDMQGNVIRKLKNSEIKDRNYISDATLYQDEFIRSFQLKHNQYPYRLVFSYKTVMSKFFQIAAIDYSHRGKPIHEGTLVVEIPSSRDIKFQQRNIERPKIQQSGDNTVYRWNFAYSPRPYQVDAPYTDEKAPFLQVLPIDFQYGVPGSTRNWQTFGSWIFRLNAGKDKLPLSETEKIDKLTAGLNDKRGICRELFHYLQDYNRYINVSINVGGLQTYPAEYVCTNRYGDCKALTNYMKAILKHAGIESFYTLINMNEEVKDIDPAFASQAFNHVILTVPLDNDTLYLECTSKSLPFGYVHTSIQNRKALLIDERGSRLIEIPALSYIETACSRRDEIQLGQGGVDHVNTSMTQRGDKFESALYLLLSDKKDDLEKYIIRNTSSDILGFEECVPGKFERGNKHFSISAAYRIPASSKTYGSNLVITPFSRKITSYQTPENREQEVRLDYPEYYADTAVYIIKGKEIAKIPADIERTTPFGTYSQKYEKSGDKFYIYKTIHIFAGRYDLSQYEEFYKFIQSIRNNENKKIYLELL